MYHKLKVIDDVDNYISEDGTDILEGFISYAKPLIQGESRPEMKDGLPVYCYRK